MVYDDELVSVQFIRNIPYIYIAYIVYRIFIIMKKQKSLSTVSNQKSILIFIIYSICVQLYIWRRLRFISVGHISYASCFSKMNTERQRTVSKYIYNSFAYLNMYMCENVSIRIISVQHDEWAPSQYMYNMRVCCTA